MLNLDNTTELLQLFSDATRIRLLSLLEGHELTVAELTATTGLSQSRVSTHLGKLRDAGLLHDRPAGTSTFYRLNELAMPEQHRKLWQLLRQDLGDDLLRSDESRLDALLQARRTGQRWPDSIAGEMERHYSPGRTWESMARGLVGLTSLGDVLDIGCGDGTTAQLLAGQARTITCLDLSAKLLNAARARLGQYGHIRYSSGDMHALPLCGQAFDQVLMYNVLTHAHDPAGALGEAARVLRPGGRLAVVTLASHGHLDQTGAYNHVQPGFAPQALHRMLAVHGLTVRQCEITSREKRSPHFQVVSAFATKCETKAVHSNG